MATGHMWRRVILRRSRRGAELLRDQLRSSKKRGGELQALGRFEAHGVFEGKTMQHAKRQGPILRQTKKQKLMAFAMVKRLEKSVGS